MNDDERLINALTVLRSGALYMRDGYRIMKNLNMEGNDTFAAFEYQYDELATAIQIEINKVERGLQHAQ